MSHDLVLRFEKLNDDNDTGISFSALASSASHVIPFSAVAGCPFPMDSFGFSLLQFS